MNASVLLAEAVELARELNYHVREELLDGAGGGHCTFGGKKWLLLDVGQSSEEQLGDVVDALRTETELGQLAVSPGLSAMLHEVRAAA